MELNEFLAEWHNDNPRILVHTSGSTGKPKPLMVEKRRMLNSARITCDFLGLKPGDTALLCMPLDYIAGKMMVVRSLQRDLRLTTVRPSSHPLADDALPSFTFAAMVPMQVYNTLKVPCERERLMHIRHLIIGGGAISDELAQMIKPLPNTVWSTYGMTETLSHIALRRLNGPDASLWYTPFDGVGISLNADGCLVIDAPEVCAEPLVTNDIALLRTDDRTGKTLFRIKGRKDNVVCSGGIKIQIEEVEETLRPHLSMPFMIVKKQDEMLGEKAILLTESADLTHIEEICTSTTCLSLRQASLNAQERSEIIRPPLHTLSHHGDPDALFVLLSLGDEVDELAQPLLRVHHHAHHFVFAHQDAALRVVRIVASMDAYALKEGHAHE